MSAHPMVEAAFGAARQALRKARVAQVNALIQAPGIYEAGSYGRSARRLQKYWHTRRRIHVVEALKFRANAKEMRRRFADALAKTEPPPASGERQAG